jgi:hypothetical protein
LTGILLLGVTCGVLVLMQGLLRIDPLPYEAGQVHKKIINIRKKAIRDRKKCINLLRKK